MRESFLGALPLLPSALALRARIAVPQAGVGFVGRLRSKGRAPSGATRFPSQPRGPQRDAGGQCWEQEDCVGSLTQSAVDPGSAAGEGVGPFSPLHRWDTEAQP